MEYTVRVIATNDVGDGAPSEEAAGTPGEITPPALSSATVDAATLTLTYNETLDEDSVPAAEAFTVSVDGIARAVEGIAVKGRTVTLTLASAVTAEDAVTVSYAAPTDAAASRILNTGGKAAASFSEQAITNNQPRQGQDTPQNAPATGAPAITGALRVKETLEVDTSGITDPDGLDNVSFTHQWLADNTGIENATDPSYTLTEADEGKALSVRVSFTDDAGNEEKLTSPATEAVASATPNATPTGVPTIMGTPRVDATLTADTSNIADDDGLDNVSFTHQWLADDAEIEDATESSYTLADTDEGKTINVRVSFTDDAGNAETLNSPVTDAVAPAPVWSATLTVADAGKFSGYNAHTETGGLIPAGFTLDQADYEVRSLGTGDGSLRFSLTEQAPDGLTLWVGAVEYPLENASHSTGEDPGNSEDTLHHYSWNPDVPSWPAGGEVAVSLTLNNADDAGDQSANSPATGAPTITGTAQVGETLTADTSAIEDSDGLEDVSFTYQWLIDDAEIEEATGLSYTLTNADEGKAIKVMVSFNDDADNRETLVSAPTDAVQPQPNNAATGVPAITGTVQVGKTLNVDTSAISDPDGMENVTFYYQWFAGDPAIQETTESSYTLTEADEGKTIQVRVSFTDDAGNHETRTSHGTGPVEPGDPPNTPAGGAPAITGDARVGETLTADTSGISDPDGMENAVFTYRWMAGGAGIPGADGSSHVLTEDEEGMTVQVWVSFTDDAGNPETLTSPPTGAVVPREPPPAPENLTATVNPDGSVTLTWDNPQDDSITGYQVLRRRPQEGEDRLLVYVENTGNTGTSYTDTDVTPGVRHVYRVKAINAAGLSQRSNYVRVTP